jgi:hypothetical protein
MANGVMNILPYKSQGGFSAYDQFDQYGSRPRPQGGMQTAVQGNQLTQYGRGVADDPRFADVLAPVYGGKPIAERGQEYFQQGLQTSAPSQGISPETQQILNIIRQQQDYAQRQGVSQAQSLAAKRGITGSSMEQFGTQQAIEAAARSGQDASAQVLGQNFAANEALKQMQAQALFQRAGQQQEVGTTEAGLGNQRDILASQLTSDELASLRGIQQAGSDRALQQYLGERGIQAQNQATYQSGQNAKRANDPFNLLIGGVGAGIGSPF